MRFIEIRDGVSIDIDEIEVVEKKDEYTTTIYTHHNVYEANFPYMALLQLLAMETEVPKSEKVEVNAHEQFWAG